jgi:hypothetical protein
MKTILFIFLILWPLNGQADPFLVSGTWNVDKPTHCYLYLDGSATPIKSLVGTRGDGSVYCRPDLSSLTVGTHTAEISGAIESGGILQVESTKSVLSPISKEICPDASVCIYKYQMGDTIIWYK